MKLDDVFSEPCGRSIVRSHWSLGQNDETGRRVQISDFRKSIPKPRYPNMPIGEIAVIRGKNRFILLAIFLKFSRLSSAIYWTD